MLGRLFIIFVSVIFALTTQLFAGELRCDIDGDGKKERLVWQKFATDDMGDYFQIFLYGHDGKLLWQGPQSKKYNDPYVYSSLHDGVSLPELFHDIDGDGRVDLLAPEPQSDVSPTEFRRLAWTGKSFEKLSSQSLMEKDAGSGVFLWMNTQKYTGTWISKLGTVDKNGLVQADITQYGGDSKGKSGKALLRFTAKGAVVERWIQPLKTWAW